MAGSKRTTTDQLPASSYRRRQLLDLVDSYLEDCYAARTAARVSEIAQRVGLSRPHLSQAFIAQFGKPLRRVMRERQVRRAQELLAITELSVDEIAVLAAFGTTPTMLKAFREIVGMTPTAFRSTLPNFTGNERDSSLKYPSVRKHGRKR